MTRETIDYARLGVEACQAYTEGPTAFADFVRTTLAVAASQYVLQTNEARRQTPRLVFMRQEWLQIRTGCHAAPFH
jgi:hypothetical protein